MLYLELNIDIFFANCCDQVLIPQQQLQERIISRRHSFSQEKTQTSPALIEEKGSDESDAKSGKLFDRFISSLSRSRNEAFQKQETSTPVPPISLSPTVSPHPVIRSLSLPTQVQSTADLTPKRVQPTSMSSQVLLQSLPISPMCLCFIR